ncbi:tyrosine-type recombinase/integrase [Serratia odorifera]|uniref:tyrosine-type recombinase/integrase n=1 Tax=Serratia odorifera TaxID=618 RepID=UPI0018E701D9|nr:tyrosine-type recombinase/integrase [Serratia odorifera]MBJ2065674.1 tyrosine-type recombinase/integrase [Serratia odorifera]
MKTQAASALTRSEVQQFAKGLLTTHSNPIYHDVFKFGLNVSLRIADLLTLTYEEVLGGKIRIKESKTKGVKGKAVREIPVTAAAMKIAKARRKANPEHVYLFQNDSRRSTGKPITKEAVIRAFAKANEEYVTHKHVSTHTMRKTPARIMWDEGVPLEIISSRLNHSSTDVTLRYLDITKDQVNETYQNYQF